MNTSSAQTRGNKKPDFTNELAVLMRYTGNTAKAIRMFSAYSGGSPANYIERVRRQIDPCVDKKSFENYTKSDELVDLMYLADSLHNFDLLGSALSSGDLATILSVCDDLLVAITNYDLEQTRLGARQSRPTFERWQHLVDLDMAKKAISCIRDKASVAST